MVVYVFTTSVRFTADAIERATFLSAKQLPLSKIHGRREYVVQFAKGGRTRYLKLESNDPNFPTLDFSRNYNFDEAFYKWFYSLPDLDARDKEVHKDSNFGLV